jgi:acyl-coenzyme A thioesterase PaaI-like protein
MNRDDIRERVLAGIARNRTPGFHFAGNFLDIAYGEISPERTRVSLEPGAHSVDAEGRTDLGAIAMVADIAMAIAVRAALGSDSARLATVAMHLQFTGIEARGPLEGEGAFVSFLDHAAARQGLARVALTTGGAIFAAGTGAFMTLAPPPGVRMHPVVTRRADDIASLDPASFDAAEREVLAHADAVLATGRNFITGFWGYEAERSAEGARCVMANGPHAGNRVGHAQGGLLVGLAATTAGAALPSTWMLAGISACFVSPGEGKELTAISKVAHQGRETAVVRTEVSGVGARRVLEAVTTHARRKS